MLAFRRLMNYDEAVAHESFKELSHITDHVIAEDRIIGEYLAASLPVALDKRTN